MNIIVTGGAGFIGANFIFYLLGHHPEDRVICLDKLTYAGNLETLAPVMDDPRFRFVRADIADAEAVDRLFEEEKPDIVVNFAAESHVDRSITDPCIFVRTNVMGTQVLMESCRKYGVAALPPGIHRRGVRRSASGSAGPVFHRGNAAAYFLALFGQQGRSRSAGAGLCPYVWPAGKHHPLLQQLWPLSLSRKADPPDDLPAPWRTSPCPFTARGKTCATGFTWRTTVPPSTW